MNSFEFAYQPAIFLIFHTLHFWKQVRAKGWCNRQRHQQGSRNRGDIGHTKRYKDFAFNAKGIANVYFGDYGSFQGKGFDELVEKLDPEVNASISAALEATSASIESIGAPFDQMLASAADSPQRQNAEQTVEALETQAQQFQKLASVLGITVDILAE